MVDIDVDDIAEVNFLDAEKSGKPERVQIILKDGTEKIYDTSEFPEILALLNHWTPPTA